MQSYASFVVNFLSPAGPSRLSQGDRRVQQFGVMVREGIGDPAIIGILGSQDRADDES